MLVVYSTWKASLYPLIKSTGLRPEGEVSYMPWSDRDTAAAGTADSNSPKSRWSREPTIREIVVLGAMTMLLTALVVSALGGYWIRVPTFGDNGPFVLTAGKIVRGGLGGNIPQQLFGYPYFGALVYLITPLGISTSLLVVCWLSACIGLALAHRLWGGWVAGFFAVTSVAWIQHATLGGAQSLALALTFGSFLLARKERWHLAALLAAICTVVRPEGAIALVALGLVLLWNRKFKTLAGCVGIGFVVGALYAAPMYFAYGDPLVNYHTYHSVVFTESLLSWPFAGMIRAVRTPTTPLSQQLMVAFWMAVVVVGMLAMCIAPHFRRYATRHQYEVLYLVLLVAFYICYNTIFAFTQFPRFTLTIIPIIYFALLPWLPKDRRMLWVAGILTSVFSGASAMNVRRSLSVVQNWLLS